MTISYYRRKVYLNWYGQVFIVIALTAVEVIAVQSVFDTVSIAEGTHCIQAVPCIENFITLYVIAYKR